VVKWLLRNEGFEDKKRTGRLKGLNEAAKKFLKKAKYKRGNSTRQLSQQLASKGVVEGGGHWGVLNTAITAKKNDKYRIIAKKIAKYRNTAGRPKSCQKSMK